MAIDFGSLSMRLNPLSAINPGSLGQMGMERERLKLMREQFENTKKQQEEENRLHQLAEQGQMARAKMQGEREQKKAEAKAAAELQKNKLSVYQKFTELNGAGDLAGARSMVPIMSSLGMGVEEQGEEGGFPRYRISMDAQKDAAAEDQRAAIASPYGDNETSEQSLSRLSTMGLEGETGTLDDPQLRKAESSGGDPSAVGGGALPLDPAALAATSPEEDEHPLGAAAPAGLAPAGLPGNDAYAQALAASQYAREHGGQALRGPDKKDYTGSVPSDVIDTGAQHELTLATLNPALQGLASAYPDEASRESAAKTAAGIEAMPLTGQKALEEYKSQRGGPDAIMVANAQNDRFRETRDKVTPKDIEMYGRNGRKSALETAKSGRVPEAVQALDQADIVDDMLADKDHVNDTMIAGALMEMQAIKGVPSDRDLAAAFGMEKASFMDQVLAKIEELAVGGFSTIQRDAIRSFVARTRDSQKAKVWDYLRGAENPGSSYNEYGVKGYQDQASKIVPEHWRGEYEDEKAAAGAEGEKAGKRKSSGSASSTGSTSSTSGEPPAATGEFDKDLESQAKAAGLDPNKLKPIIHGESGGKSTAVSTEGASGVMQIMPANLKAMGIDPDEYRKLSASEQLPAVMRFLKGQGLTADSTPEEYVMAVAASDPKFRTASNDTVVYKKGSDAWKANKPWRPADDGDITRGSILAYYGVSNDKPGDKAAAAPAETKPKLSAAALPEPKTPEEKRLRELLLKAGG
jgi:hypothetical protein